MALRIATGTDDPRTDALYEHLVPEVFLAFDVLASKVCAVVEARQSFAELGGELRGARVQGLLVTALGHCIALLAEQLRVSEAEAVTHLSSLLDAREQG